MNLNANKSGRRGLWFFTMALARADLSLANLKIQVQLSQRTQFNLASRGTPLQRIGIPNVIFSRIQPQRSGEKKESSLERKVAHAAPACVSYRVCQ